MIHIKAKGIDNIIKNLQKRISVFEDMSDNLAELLAKAFVARARKRLLNFTGQKRYSYYINAVHNGDNSWSVIVRSPKYDPYIMYFLEYGTGFVGERSEQNPDKPADWKYTINKGASWYGVIAKTGEEGWWFNYRPNHFIQPEDYFFPEEHKAFTSGIKPVMYMYKTKTEINSLLQSVVKDGNITVTYKQLKRQLNALISGDTT